MTRVPIMLKAMAVGACLVLCASMAHAVPILQVYLEGATYVEGDDMDTWVLAGGFTGGSARLWVIGNVDGAGGKGPIEDVHLAIAYGSEYTPLISLTPSVMTSQFVPPWQDPSLPVAPVYESTNTGGVPTLTDGSPLASHGIYGDDTTWQQFELGDFAATDSQVADFQYGFPTQFEGWGQINVYDVSVLGVLADESFTLHFDVYNHIEGSTRSLFAPFSHDAEFQPQMPPPIPEPASLILLGCVGAGMLVARRVKRFRK